MLRSGNPATLSHSQIWKLVYINKRHRRPPLSGRETVLENVGFEHVESPQDIAAGQPDSEIERELHRCGGRRRARSFDNLKFRLPASERIETSGHSALRRKERASF